MRVFIIGWLILIFFNLSLSAEYKEGEIIVKVRGSVNIKAGKERIKALGRLGDVRYLHIVDKSKSTEELIKEWKNREGVIEVVPNYKVRIFQIPNDPEYPQQWAMDKISAPDAWNVATGSNSVVVAVVDTGVDYNHEDLIPNMWVNPYEIPGNGIDDDNNGYVDDVYGVDVVNGDGDPMDDNGHGTHVAGIIGAVGNNGTGIAGVNWNVKIMAVKALGAGGVGDIASVIDALNYVLEMKRKGVNIVVVNASYGCEGCQPAPDRDIIAALGAEGVIFVTAAGNSGSDNDTVPTYPASYDLDNIIAVAAVDSNDNLAPFSNYGATSVDIAAPGVNIYSTYPRTCDYIPSPGDIFFDDMEGGSANWSTGGTPNNWSIVTDSSKASQVWDDSPSGDYANNSNTWLSLNNPIDLSAVAGDVCLGFETIFSTEAFFDFVYIEYSKDGGVNWNSIAGLTGFVSAYTYLAFPVDDDYKTSSFSFRFRLVSDDTITDDGIRIDNVGVGLGTVLHNYKKESGTSMAAPFVTGAVALLASAYPNEDMRARILRIIYNADQIPSLKDKVISGGRLNIYKALINKISAPEISLSSSEVFFGYVDVGSTKSKEIAVSNYGYDLVIKNIYIQGVNKEDFSFYNGCAEKIIYGQTCSIVVYFMPKSSGSKNAELIIESNDIDNPKVKVILKGIGEEVYSSGGCYQFNGIVILLLIPLLLVRRRSYLS